MAPVEWVLFLIFTDLYFTSGLPAPFTEAPSSPVYAKPGSNVTLKWNYDSSNLDTIYIKYKKTNGYENLVYKDNLGTVTPGTGVPVSLTSRVTITDNATLVIRNVNYDDSTMYRCSFEPLFGPDVITDAVQVIVAKPPDSVTVEPTIQQAKGNSSATFTCTYVNGTLAPSDVTWTRLYNKNETWKTGNGVMITGAGSSSNLTIHPVDYAHHGMYQCEAKNAKEEIIFGTGTLVVPHFRPLPAPGVITFRAEIKEKVALACPVFGFPRPAIKWHYPNGSTKEDLLTNILYFTVQKDSDFGKYSCSAGDKAFKFMVEKYEKTSITSTAQPTSSDCTTELVVIIVIVILAIIAIVALSVLLYKAKEATKHQQIPMQSDRTP